MDTASALAALVDGHEEAFAEAGGVDALLTLADSESAEVRERALTGLCQMAASHAALIAAAPGAIAAVVGLAKIDTSHAAAVRTLRHLAVHAPDELVASGGLEQLSLAASSSDPDGNQHRLSMKEGTKVLRGLSLKKIPLRGGTSTPAAQIQKTHNIYYVKSEICVDLWRPEKAPFRVSG